MYYFEKYKDSLIREIFNFSDFEQEDKFRFAFTSTN